MNEGFLQFLWYYQLFDYSKIETACGQKIKIVKKGDWNRGEGPDFLNAQLWIGNDFWCGHIELHIKASDWYAHHHYKHQAYNAVILHIVWDLDADVFHDVNLIPTLILKAYVDNVLIQKHEQYFRQSVSWMLCESYIGDIDSLYLAHWLRKMFLFRFLDKQKEISKVFNQNKFNWEAVFFYYLCKALGFKTNQTAFEMFANSFPFKLVQVYASDSVSLEALFFGQSGLLTDFDEVPYAKRLLLKYEYLRKKHRLVPCSQNLFQFHRMRPQNFPTIRLGQLTAIYSQRKSVFNQCMQLETLKEFVDFFSVDLPQFWKYHFHFNSVKKLKNKPLSKHSVRHLLINAILPVKFAYLKQYKDMPIDEIELTIETLKPEENQVVKGFKRVGLCVDNAMVSQGLIHLKRHYCDQFKCYQCQIGLKILK